MGEEEDLMPLKPDFRAWNEKGRYVSAGHMRRRNCWRLFRGKNEVAIRL